jgi:multidrug efflux pump
MNISKFFIDRPIFASVLSVLLLLGGILSLFQLPISEYPEVVPPSVVVRAQYPGANPKVIAETVASPLEESINGVENMLYIQSQAGRRQPHADGHFKLGTDPDKAQQMVQNRVSQALPRLPEDVQRLGVTTVKSSPTLTMVVHLISPDDKYDATYLRNYAVLNIKDRLARCRASAKFRCSGCRQLRHARLARPAEGRPARPDSGRRGARHPRTERTGCSRRDRRLAGAAGRRHAVLSQCPGPPAERAGVRDIVLKSSPDGSITRLADVARVELDAAEYGLRSLLNNKPAIGMGIFQSPGANALDVSSQVRATMAELAKDFPPSVEYRIVYDPTQFVRASIKAVVVTLLEAIAAGRAGGDPVPADLARLDHPAAGGAGVHRRHLRADARLSRSTPCRCSAWCWRSASSSTTPSSWSRTSSATSRPA